MFVFTSDHGDMLGSHAHVRKQWPWDESILVPLVVRYPRRQGAPRQVDTPVSMVDLMPTLLQLASAPIPEAVEGVGLAHLVTGEPATIEAPETELIESIAPFSESWPGPEWRGVRSARYTYVETLEGPWLLYDNAEDPYQQHNLVGDAAHAALQRELAGELRMWLERTHDDFQPGEVYMRRYGYPRGPKGEVPYSS